MLLHEKIKKKYMHYHQKWIKSLSGIYQHVSMISEFWQRGSGLQACFGTV